jgi:hypothetical protein
MFTALRSRNSSVDDIVLFSLLHSHGCLATLCEGLERCVEALDSLLAARTNSRMYDVTATMDVKTTVFMQNRKHRLKCRAQFAVAWAIVEVRVIASHCLHAFLFTRAALVAKVLSVATLTRHDVAAHRLSALLSKASLLRAAPKRNPLFRKYWCSGLPCSSLSLLVIL